MTRARLAASDHPDRIFHVTLAAAKRSGLVGHRRVLEDHQHLAARGALGPRPSAQRDPAWRTDYRAARPKVERKIGHLMRRRHGGRRARVRRLDKISADLSSLAAAVNLARLAVLKTIHTGPEAGPPPQH